MSAPRRVAPPQPPPLPPVPEWDKFTPAQIASVLPGVCAALGADGRLISAYQLYAPVCEALGSDWAGGAPAAGYRRRQAEDRFASRVTRAMDKLAAQGLLRRQKFGHGGGPGGSYVHRGNTGWYTIAGWDTAEARVRAADAQRAADELRVRDVARALLRYGWSLDRRRLSLTLPEWEQLTAMLEAGRA